jgi:hypothetical protein
MEKFGYHCSEFREILYLGVLAKSLDQIQFLLKSNKNTLNKKRKYTKYAYLNKSFRVEISFRQNGCENENIFYCTLG